MKYNKKTSCGVRSEICKKLFALCADVRSEICKKAICAVYESSCHSNIIERMSRLSETDTDVQLVTRNQGTSNQSAYNLDVNSRKSIFHI